MPLCSVTQTFLKRRIGIMEDQLPEEVQVQGLFFIRTSSMLPSPLDKLKDMKRFFGAETHKWKRVYEPVRSYRARANVVAGTPLGSVSASSKALLP